MSVFVIGEIGINHNGDLALAKKLIKVPDSLSHVSDQDGKSLNSTYFFLI